MEEAKGEDGGALFADLTAEQYQRGMDWLSHEPVSYEYSMNDKNWIILRDYTPEQLSNFRENLGE